MVKSQKSQISIQITWIFILIAGALILFFFVGLVYKQKAVAEVKTSATIISELEGIFAGARLSIGATQLIKIPDTELNFLCEQGYSEFSIPKTGIAKEFPIEAVFSPKTLKGDELLSLALDFKIPFRAGQILYLTSPRIKYVFVFGGTTDIGSKINTSMKDLFVVETDPSIVVEEGFDQVKYVYFNSAPDPAKTFGEDRKAITINEVAKTITFYPGGTTAHYFDLSTAIGAVFSDDYASYVCNLQRALKRSAFITEIYINKTKALKNHYEGLVPECGVIYGASLIQLEALKQAQIDCSSKLEDSCITNIQDQITDEPGSLKWRNEVALPQFPCAPIY